MNRTTIEWCTMTVNPLRARRRDTDGRERIGHYCEKVSPGCKFCYSSRLQPRFGMPPFNEQRGDDSIETFLDVDRLVQVLKRRKPERIFWCDMTDLFGSWVPDAQIAACLGVMALTPHHTHLVLTKRSARRRDFFALHGGRYESNLAWWINEACYALADRRDVTAGIRLRERTPRVLPLPNVWHGDSIENQEAADERVPLLLQTPAAVRFLSVEPLLGPVNLDPPHCQYCPDDLEELGHAEDGTPWCMRCDSEMPQGWWLEPLDDEGKPLNGPAINWVIVGGESGPKARPMNPQWARDIRDQCIAAGVPCFFKQWGEYASVSEVEGPGAHYKFPDGRTVRRVGKKRAGRELDGREWNEFPKSGGA